MTVEELLVELESLKKKLPELADQAAAYGVYKRWLGLLKQNAPLVTPEMIEPLISPARERSSRRPFIASTTLFEMLGPVPVPAVWDRLLREIQSESPERRIEAAYWLVEAAPGADEAIDALWKLHRDERPTVRELAPGAAARLAVKRDDVFDRLLRDLRDGEPLLRFFCAKALALCVEQLHRTECAAHALVEAVRRGRRDEDIEALVRKTLKDTGQWAVDLITRALRSSKGEESVSADRLRGAAVILTVLAGAVSLESAARRPQPDADEEAAATDE